MFIIFDAALGQGHLSLMNIMFASRNLNYPNLEFISAMELNIILTIGIIREFFLEPGFEP